MTSLTIDLIVLGLLSISAIIGFSRGLTQECLGLLSWLGAFFSALYGFPFMRPVLQGYISNATLVDIAGGLILFVVSFLILALVTRALGHLVRHSLLSGIDRSLGIVFGIGRGWVLISLAYFVALYMSTPALWPTAVVEARFLPIARMGAAWLYHLAAHTQIQMPDEIASYLTKKVTDLTSDQQVNTLSGLAPKQPDAASAAPPSSPASSLPTESAHDNIAHPSTQP